MLETSLQCGKVYSHLLMKITNFGIYHYQVMYSSLDATMCEIIRNRKRCTVSVMLVSETWVGFLSIQLL